MAVRYIATIPGPITRQQVEAATKEKSSVTDKEPRTSGSSIKANGRHQMG